MTTDKQIPYGSDVSAGSFECLDCGYRIDINSTESLPPCPKFDATAHSRKGWRAVSGQGDATDDPHNND